MNDEIAKGIVDAYRVNPLLTGLLILNIGMFIGFGWYIVYQTGRAGEFIQLIRSERNALERELLDLAKTCIIPK